MSKNGWDFILPESFYKMQEVLNSLSDSFLKTQEVLNNVSTSALAISKTLNAAMPNYDFSGVYAAWNVYLANCKNISRQIEQVSNVAKAFLPLIDGSARTTFADTIAMKVAFDNVDWSWLPEIYSKVDEESVIVEPHTEEEIDSKIRSEMAADISEVLADPENMHITSREKYIEWAKESPEHGLQFLNILIAIITLLLGAISTGVQVWQALTVKNSQVYEEPTSTSNVVYNLAVENNVTVIGNVPYYYEVEFTNPETGETVTGYIYKGNISAEEPVETEEYKQETEPTDETEPTTDTTENQAEPTE